MVRDITDPIYKWSVTNDFVFKLGSHNELYRDTLRPSGTVGSSARLRRFWRTDQAGKAAIARLPRGHLFHGWYRLELASPLSHKGLLRRWPPGRIVPDCKLATISAVAQRGTEVSA